MVLKVKTAGRITIMESPLSSVLDKNKSEEFGNLNSSKGLACVGRTTRPNHVCWVVAPMWGGSSDVRWCPYPGPTIFKDGCGGAQYGPPPRSPLKMWGLSDIYFSVICYPS